MFLACIFNIQRLFLIECISKYFQFSNASIESWYATFLGKICINPGSMSLGEPDALRELQS